MMGIGDYFNKFVCAKGNGKMIRNCAIIAGIVLIVGAAVLTPLYIVNGLIVAKLLSACTYLCMMIIAYRKTIQVN
jgi:uncharacterized membrane protein (DUF485 family)